MKKSVKKTSGELPPKKDSWKMFNRIAPTYDSLNRVLSAGVDRSWRRKLAEKLPESPGQLRLLDLATGTGDQLLTLLKAAPNRFLTATGADPAAHMLVRARRKPLPRLLGIPQPEWVEASADRLPFEDDSFDVVTMSFGIRNVPDPLAALKEIRRVLTPGGRALILEFSIPANAIVRNSYLLYFRHVLPAIGGFFSGDRDAYRYLNSTVEDFPYGEAFCSLLRDAGFAHAQATALTVGISTLYSAEGVVGQAQ
jgi:demethylmenaquinone methyltransferase / 2-methoxy-6-polyprenyl-1,4-benzoquinol methylase